MTDYSTTLLRSLLDRAGTLGSYVRKLQSGHSRRNDAFAGALEMFHLYTRLVARQAEYEWTSFGGDPERRLDLLRGRIKDFFEKENWFDRRFARGRQSDVPRALYLIARRELRGHGLNTYEPVLTVGPPDSFETHRADLSSYLFNGLFTARLTDFDGLPEAHLAIVSVPYIEGMRALWYPITVGHEIGHIRLEARRGTGANFSLGTFLDEEDAELAALVDDTALLTDDGGLGVVRHLQETLQSWLEEILCDLNAVRLYGPAGMSAIAEFLAVLSQPRKGAPHLPTPEHPALATRLRMMFAFLDRLGETERPDQLEPWNDYLSMPNIKLGPKALYLERILDNNLNDILNHALTWGECYRRKSRTDVIEWVRSELGDGVPGGTYCIDGPARGQRIEVADVVAGAWSARRALDADYIERRRTEDYRQPGNAVADAGFGEDGPSIHERRLILDELASKSIDTLEFATLWRAAGGDIVNVGELKHVENDEGLGGVLSRRAVEARLSSPLRNTRLGITPLLEGSIQSAAVDLRLSPDFIVFRHTAASAFDPLALHQDPRSLQEPVDKAWGEPFILHPSELVLASTLEYISLPEDISAQVVTRSSYGRLGLITATAVQIQPGSHNCITLELVNLGPTPIVLMPGSRIAQLILFAVPNAGEVARGKYDYPVGPEFSKVQSDADGYVLRNISTAAYRSMDGSVYERERRESDQILAFTLRGTYNEAMFYQQVITSEGGHVDVEPQIDIGSEAGGGTDARFWESMEPIVTYLAVGSFSFRILTNSVLRLVRGLKRGVIAKVGDNGEIELISSNDLPRGRMIIVSSGKPRIELQIDSESSSDDFGSALKAVLPKPRRDGRWNEE